MSFARFAVPLVVVAAAYASHSMLAAHVGEPVAPPIHHRLPTPTVDAAAPPDAPVDAAPVSPVKPRRHRLFWCELTNVSIRGWRGVSMVLPDGRSMRRFAVPGVGLVPDAPVGTAPAYRVRIERTEWGYGGDKVHVGIAATIDSARYCFEWRDPNVVPVTCR